MPELNTVDLAGVEVMSIGGPIHGIGSPPEGDNWTADDLRAMAAAAAELGDEIKAPNKLGHSDKQALTRGEMPAIGWLDNVRTNDDGSKLLADIKAVPEKVAQLIKAGAYRTRSVELSAVTSQRTGKKYDWVVTGLAWLGGQMPAVRTLADVVKLYEGDVPTDVQRVFNEEQGLDVEHAGVLIEGLLRGYADTVTHELAEPIPTPRRRADIRRDVPEKTYTDEQRRIFAEATGLEADKVTDEMLAKAGVASETPEPPDPDPKLQLEHDETRRELASTKDEVGKLKEDLRLERRAAFVDAALKAGRIEPGQREDVEKLYDEAPETARKFVESLPVNDELVREFGSGEDGDEDEQTRQREFEDDFLSRTLSIPKEELV